MSMNASSPNVRPIPSVLPSAISLGGIIAGLGGGLAMAVVGALISLYLNGDVWRESKEIASIIYGNAVLADQGFAAGPVITGTLLHFLMSALLGLIFAIVTRSVLHLTSDFGALVLCGLIYGLLIWALAYFILLPLVNPVLLDTYAPSFIFQHLVYGAVTGLLYTWLRPAPYDP